MTLTERISALAKEQNLTFASLERMAGLGNGTIKRWDKNDPSVGKLLKIANILNASLDYLVSGNYAPCQALSSEDQEFLSLFRRLPYDVQLEFKGEIKGYLKCLDRETVAAEEPIREEPIRKAK